MKQTKKSKTPKDIPLKGIKGLYQRGSTFRFNRMVKGNPIRKSLGADINKARLIAENLNHKIKMGEDVFTELTADNITIYDLFDEVSRYEINITDSSRKRYNSVKVIFNFWCKEKGLSKITNIKPAHIDAYLKDRSCDPIIPNDHELRKGMRPININGTSDSTLTFEKGYLNKVFNHAVNKEWIKDNPVKKATITFKKKKQKTSDISLRSFTKDEMNKLIETAGTMRQHKSFGNCTWQEILTFFFKTGLREQELLNLQWSDVDWSKGEYGVIHLDEKEYIETIKLDKYPYFRKLIKQSMQDKNHNDFIFEKDELEKLSINRLPIRSHETLLSLRFSDINTDENKWSLQLNQYWKPKATTGFVPLSQGAHKSLKSIAERNDQSGFVFSSQNGGKIRIQLLPILKETVKVAKINNGKRKLTLHSTRHTFGCMLRDSGVPLETIMGLMRHSDIKETLRYAPYSLIEGAKAIQLLDH